MLKFLARYQAVRGGQVPTEARHVLQIDQRLFQLQKRAHAERALEAAGVEFISENGGGPGVRLRKG